MKRPQFMKDDSVPGEQHNPSEQVMDYMLSWTLRNSVEDIKQERPILQKYCKNLICAFMGMSPYLVKIISTKVWWQYKNIDLWVEVKLLVNGDFQNHAICIEDKVYDSLRNGQPEGYREYFETYYNNKPKENWHRHYVLPTFFESWETSLSKYDHAQEVGFTIFPWDKMDNALKISEASESEIFNEFWCPEINNPR